METATVIATFIEKRKLISIYRDIYRAVWNKVEINGQQVPGLYYSNYGDILKKLDPKPNQVYQIKLARPITGNTFEFPVEFINLESNQRFVYDFRHNALYEEGNIPDTAPRRRVIEKSIWQRDFDYMDTKEFTGIFAGKRFMTTRRTQYYLFDVDQKESEVLWQNDCLQAVITKVNEGMTMIPKRIGDQFYVQTHDFLIKHPTTIEKIVYRENKPVKVLHKIAMAKFPILIINKTLKKTVQFNAENYRWSEK